MSERRRLAVVLLAASGALIGHAIAYAMAGVALGARHAYLESLGEIVMPLGFAAAALLTVRSARASGLVDSSLKVRHLAATQMALFGAQEVFEATATGSLGRLDLTTFALGLAVQIPVAWALAKLVEFGASALRAFLAPPQAARSATRAHTPSAGSVVIGHSIDSWLSRRGPPVASGQLI